MKVSGSVGRTLALVARLADQAKQPAIEMVGIPAAPRGY
jgi:hypothetical protein